MNATSVDISDILEAETALGLTLGTNLFIGREPVTPSDCVTIFDTPGYAPQLTLDGANDYYFPSIQIRVRNTKYLDAESLIHNIMVSLHGRNHETWNSTLYTLIKCTTEPALLDWDENNRARFVVNFDIQRRT
jgi:hypothetical protein